MQAAAAAVVADLGLRWADVDFDAARLSVRQAVVAVAYAVIESTPKSHNARVIDLDSETVDLLQAHRRQQREERDEWGADYVGRDLVVCHENGSPIHPHRSARPSRGLSSGLGSASFAYTISATHMPRSR